MEEIERQVADALLPITKDKRDFKLGAVTPLPKLEELPPDFEHQPVFVGNQSVTDFCTGWGTDGASALQEGVALVPEYAFALNKLAQGGNVDDFGCDLRSACKARCDYGSIEEKDRPEGFTFPNGKEPQFLRRIENWPAELKAKALAHAKGSFLDANTGPYDAFDNIRAAIWYYRNEKRAVVSGCNWGYSIRNPIIEHPGGGGGHCIYYPGWRTIKGVEYLVLVNSMGDDVPLKAPQGDGGKWFVSREFVNFFVAMYGAFMFLDLAPSEYQAKLRNQISILTQIVELLKKVLGLKAQINAQQPKNGSIPPVPLPPTRPTLDDLADAMAKIEDVNPSLNNPLALRWSPFEAGHIIQHATGKPLSYFSTPKDGRDAGIYQFRIVCNGKSPAYTAAAKQRFGLTNCGDLTIAQFISIYAPSGDLNDPDRYARDVAKDIKVGLDFKMKYFL